jgi:hypothetical protein
VEFEPTISVDEWPAAAHLLRSIYIYIYNISNLRVNRPTPMHVIFCEKI